MKLFKPLVCFGLALVFMGPVLFAAGWPHNHEYYSVFERVEILRRAWLDFDLFPVWSPFPHDGRGSPVPLFYHRGFNYLAVVFALPLGTNVGVRCALALVGAFGAWGMWRAAESLHASKWLGALAAVLWLSAPYTLLDWLVRGAAAEFLAMAILPWVLDALLRCFRERTGFTVLGLWLSALFHAHQSFALFVFPLLLAMAGAALWCWRKEGVSLGEAVLPLWKTAAVGVALCAPFAIAVTILGKHFHLEILKQFVPWEHYEPLKDYFFKPEFKWGQQWKGITPELGVSLWLLALSSIVAVAWTRARGLDRKLVPVLVALGAAAVMYAVLQAPWSAGFYRRVPLAVLLQFPWRLNGMLTPLMILGAVAVWSQVIAQGGQAKWAGFVAAGVSLVAAIYVPARALDVRSGRFSRNELASAIDNLAGPNSGGEYAWKWKGSSPREPVHVPLLASQGCEMLEVRPPEAATQRVHAQDVSVRVRSEAGCVILWGQFPSPMIAIEGGDLEDATPQGQMRVKVAPGEHTLHFRYRNLFSATWNGL